MAYTIFQEGNTDYFKWGKCYILWENGNSKGMQGWRHGSGVRAYTVLTESLSLADWGPWRQVQVVTAQVLVQGICFLIRRWLSYVVSSISSDGAQLPWLPSHETISPNKPFSPGVPLGLRVQWQESPLRSSATHATALEHWYPALHFHLLQSLQSKCSCTATHSCKAGCGRLLLTGPKAPWSLQVLITK